MKIIKDRCVECLNVKGDFLTPVKKGNNIIHYCKQCYMRTLAGLPGLYIAWKNNYSKTCVCCGRNLQANEVNFKRNKIGVYNLNDTCIKCQSEDSKNARTKRRINKIKAVKDNNIYFWEIVLKHFNKECAYCGSKENICQDHVVPLTKNGTHTRENVVPACRKCNSTKHSKNMREWYKCQVFYDEQKYLKIINWTNQKR